MSRRMLLVVSAVALLLLASIAWVRHFRLSREAAQPNVQPRLEPEDARMGKAERLMAIVGKPANSDAVRALVASDGLEASREPDGLSVPRREYLSTQKLGYSITHVEGKVVNVVFYVEPAEGFATFQGPLPGELPRGATRQQVLARFGATERSGDAVTIEGLGRQGAWDRFVVGNSLVHFQYTEHDDRIRLVSVMAKEFAP